MLHIQEHVALAEKGVKVILGSRDKAKGDAAAAELTKQGFDVEAFQFDIDVASDHQKIADHLANQYGHLDILINNAGIMIDTNHSANATSTTAADILRKTFDTNFFQLVALTQTLLPLLRKAPAGRIVNLSSILGSLTLHADQHSQIYDTKIFAYDASKTALNAFTVHLAHELRHTKIKVNSAHPGWVKTAMGGPQAPMELKEGGITSAELALLDENGPTGAFYHLGQPLPW